MYLKRMASIVVLATGLLLFLAYESFAEGTLLASLITDREGNVPQGYQHAGDMRVYIDGRIEIYGSRDSLSFYVPLAVRKTFSADPAWHWSKLDAVMLSSLRKKIQATNFEQLDIDSNASRPSNVDATDTVAEFHKGSGKISIRLWEVKNMELLNGALDLMHECRKAAFALPTK